MLSATMVRTVDRPGRYTDGQRGNGLSLLVRPAADGGLRKVWAQRIRVGGRWRNLGLGRYPVVTLSEARDAALANARDAWRGVDPVEARRHAAGIPTFADAVEAAIEFYAKSWREGGRNASLWRQRLRDYCYPRIGKVRVDSITSADVLACVTPIWASQNATARKTMMYMQQVLAWCVAQGHTTANVAKGDAISSALPRVSAQVQHRGALHWRELPAALRQVEESNTLPTSKLAIKMLALTATRSNEVRGMMWNEVDGSTWTIPASRTKTGREHRVPLSAEAMAVLMEAQQWRLDGCAFVFPSTRGKPFVDSALMAPVRKLGGGWTVHGLRSTFRTWCDEQGHDGQLAEFALGHVVGDAASRAYRRGDLYERRALLMAEWGRVLTAR